MFVTFFLPLKYITTYPLNNESNGKDGSRKRLVLLGGDMLSLGSSDGMCETHICSFLFSINVWCMFIFIGAQLRHNAGPVLNLISRRNSVCVLLFIREINC